MKKSMMIPALVVTALGTLFVATGCGNKPTDMLRTLSGHSSVAENGDVWVGLSMNLDIGAYGIASFNIPITNPVTSEQYAQVSLSPVVCPPSNACANGAQINLSVNLTEAAKVQSTSTNLPNGTVFPLTFSENTNLVAIPIGNSGAKLYVAFNDNTTVIGAAIPFTALDPVGRYVAGVNVFGGITMNDIAAYIGIFAGAQTKQTGIGVFADLSKLVNDAKAGVSPSSSVESLGVNISGISQAQSALVSSDAPAANVVQLKQNTGSPNQQADLSYRLWKNSRKHRVLRYR